MRGVAGLPVDAEGLGPRRPSITRVREPDPGKSGPNARVVQPALVPAFRPVSAKCGVARKASLDPARAIVVDQHRLRERREIGRPVRSGPGPRQHARGSKAIDVALILPERYDVRRVLKLREPGGVQREIARSKVGQGTQSRVAASGSCKIDAAPRRRIRWSFFGGTDRVTDYITSMQTTTARLPPRPEMYRALVNRDGSYEGLFYAAIRTTGIFCRPTCGAKKPHLENVEFYPTARDALFSGYRPCKRCRPLEAGGASPTWLSGLMDELSRNPGRRWKDQDLREIGVDPASVRRWFRKEYGMTFHAYHRAMRLGSALGLMRQGKKITTTAYESGYQSVSGFREAIERVAGVAAGSASTREPLLITRVTTPIGPMVAGATGAGIYLLEFADRRMLETQMQRLVRRTQCVVTPGSNHHIDTLQGELDAYFAGRLREFAVPLETPGTDFQRACWTALQTIPYGETRSYQEQATAVGRSTAIRAVGRANGDNRIAIVVPCHRVVQSDGKLAGYGGGVWRKQWLLDLERAVARGAEALAVTTSNEAYSSP